MRKHKAVYNQNDVWNITERKKFKNQAYIYKRTEEYLNTDDTNVFAYIEDHSQSRHNLSIQTAMLYADGHPVCEPAYSVGCDLLGPPSWVEARAAVIIYESYLYLACLVQVFVHLVSVPYISVQT